MAKARSFTGVNAHYPAAKSKMGAVEYGSPSFAGLSGSPLKGKDDGRPSVDGNKLFFEQIVKAEDPKNSDAQRSQVSFGPGPTFSDKRVAKK